ncbi:MAG: S16 family serine protease [Actinomycetota bacterium]|nr:S16 family serine protease [Actinomycetota bacterium]
MPPHGPDRRWRRVAVAAAVAGGITLLAAIGAAFIRIPYYTLAPGSVRSTESLIDAETEFFGGEGDVYFTTVSVRGKITPWGALAAWLDPAVDVVPESMVLNGRSPSENREVNLQLMNNSKDLAVQVAMEHLGYDVASPVAAVVDSVLEGSAADGVLERGDVILAVDGERVEESIDVVELIGTFEPGDVVELLLRPVELDQELLAEAAGDVGDAEVPLDDDRLETVTVELGTNPEEPARPLLGIAVETRYDFEYPYEVDIDSGSVGGPSAGLAFTLGILDVLTPGELTGGDVVAVTGTINADGRVGPIGGVAQKAAAVRREGIDVFLVPDSLPDSEVSQARSLAGDEVEIIEVATLDDALAALDTLGGNGLALDAPDVDGPTS